MVDWLLQAENTQQGSNLALFLAIMAAFLHAIFGALQKGKFDPWLMRAAIDLSYGLMALPFALFIVPWPENYMWPLFFGAFIIHTAYKVMQAMAYSRGAFTVVYPIVRGIGPLLTVIVAYFVFSESFNFTQWFGVVILLFGILGLAVYNVRYLSIGRETLASAMIFACITGVLVALYTTYDAYGIRATANPFTFLAWFFLIDGIAMPIIALRKSKDDFNYSELKSLVPRGIIGGLIAFFSFGGIMLATRLDKVGEAAVLRETSIVFAAIIGWLFLKENVGPRRIFLIVLIAIGAVFVELGA
jgi:drug/metabolite transporter (DMT)-like permease